MKEIDSICIYKPVSTCVDDRNGKESSRDGPSLREVNGGLSASTEEIIKSKKGEDVVEEIGEKEEKLSRMSSRAPRLWSSASLTRCGDLCYFERHN